MVSSPVCIAADGEVSVEWTAGKPCLSFPGESIQTGQNRGRAQSVLPWGERAARLDDGRGSHAGLLLPPHVRQKCAGQQDAQAGGMAL